MSIPLTVPIFTLPNLLSLHVAYTFSKGSASKSISKPSLFNVLLSLHLVTKLLSSIKENKDNLIINQSSFHQNRTLELFSTLLQSDKSFVITNKNSWSLLALIPILILLSMQEINPKVKFLVFCSKKKKTRSIYNSD